jgi:hypothetical protein
VAVAGATVAGAGLAVAPDDDLEPAPAAITLDDGAVVGDARVVRAAGRTGATGGRLDGGVDPVGGCATVDARATVFRVRFVSSGSVTVCLKRLYLNVTMLLIV